MPATRTSRRSRASAGDKTTPEPARRREHTSPTEPTAHAGSLPEDFNQRVYAITRRVPEGKVISYGGIASLLGYPKHSRAVGHALKLLPAGLGSPYLPLPPSDSSEGDAVQPAPLPNPDWVPWHRVISSSGVISPRAGGLPAVRRQADYLMAEGVEVNDGARAGAGGGVGGADNAGAAVDAFGLGGVDGGRVSMAKYRWDGR